MDGPKRINHKGEMKIAQENQMFRLTVISYTYRLTVSQRIIKFYKFTSFGAVLSSTHPNSNTPIVVPPAELPHGWPGKRKLIGQPT